MGRGWCLTGLSAGVPGETKDAFFWSCFCLHDAPAAGFDVGSHTVLNFWLPWSGVGVAKQKGNNKSDFRTNRRVANRMLSVCQSDQETRWTRVPADKGN